MGSIEDIVFHVQGDFAVEPKYSLEVFFKTKLVDPRLGKPHVQFYETLHALAGRCAGTQLPLDEEEKISLSFAAITPAEKEYPRYTAAHYHAAMHVQAAVRGFLTRYNMRTRIDAVTKPLVA